MEFNIISLLYLFFRLAPFLIVSYFSLQSIFNQDLKGLIYLIGLLCASVITVLVGNMLSLKSISSTLTNPAKQLKCNHLTIGANGPISAFPLSQTVFGYTLAYLSYFISINNLVTQNIPIFIIFPILILADMIWNTANGCSTNTYLLSALILGGIIGMLWAVIIDSMQIADLSYFSGISNKDVCSKPSKSLYKCRAVNKGSSAVSS